VGVWQGLVISRRLGIWHGPRGRIPNLKRLEQAVK